MRTVVLMAAGMLIAVPASAQFTDRAPPTSRTPPPILRGDARLPDPAVSRDVRDIDRQIRRGRDAGTLTRREGRALRRQSAQIGSLADRYAADGMSDQERQELQLRAGVLRDQVNRDRLRGAGRK
ncbi:hypothetical protein [Sphingomonas sp. RS2018]